MATSRLILKHLDDPEKLEELFREDPEAFRDSLDEALDAARDSTVLRAWRARLEYREPARGAAHWHGLWYALGIGLAAGALVRLPAIWLTEEWYYPRFAPLWIILSLAAYFLSRRPGRVLIIAGGVLALAVVGYVSRLPDYTDSIVMALVHLPLVLWGYVGIVYLGHAWRDTRSRVRFVRYNGELVILASLLVLGGAVLSAVTIGLFELIDDSIGNWYMSNVGILGIAGIPVVATYLYDVVFNRRTAITGVLARVFAPLFLVMVVAYLIVTLVEGKNPFVDRSFLITVNGLLLLVVGISVFSLAERDRASAVGLMDHVNLALVSVTLLIDVIALSAILFRLASFGFTPNRVAVLGANVTIFGHLVWICRTYIGLVRGKVRFAAMERVVGNYLPVYGAWAAIVAFVLPVVFGFG
jgi:hypothetical protein